MTHRLLAALTAALITVGLLTVAAPATAAVDHRSCASRSELSRIHDGMTRRALTRLLDGPGRRYASGNTWENRGWGKCWSGSALAGVLLVKEHGVWRVQCERRCWF